MKESGTETHFLDPLQNSKHGTIKLLPPCDYAPKKKRPHQTSAIEKQQQKNREHRLVLSNNQLNPDRSLKPSYTCRSLPLKDGRTGSYKMALLVACYKSDR